MRPKDGLVRPVAQPADGRRVGVARLGAEGLESTQMTHGTPQRTQGRGHIISKDFASRPAELMVKSTVSSTPLTDLT
jgi:hypothetical protein